MRLSNNKLSRLSQGNNILVPRLYVSESRKPNPTSPAQIIVHDTNAKKKRQIKNKRNKNGGKSRKQKNRNSNNGSGEKSSRSLFDIFSGMLEPITTPLKNFFSGLRED